MNHLCVYNWLILRARTRPLKGYFERHHIVPRCLGGDDSAHNLIALTAREHFLAHLLLAKIHGGRLWYAVIMLKAGTKTSRLYEIARRENARSVAHAQAGVKHSAARVAANSAAQRIAQNLPATKLKQSLAKRGKKLSQSHRDAISIAQNRTDNKEHHSAAVKAAMNSPEIRARLLAAMASIEVREKISNSLQLAHANPESRARYAAAFSSLEYRERQAAAAKASWAKRKAAKM